jgi:hypothetical protein
MEPNEANHSSGGMWFSRPARDKLSQNWRIFHKDALAAIEDPTNAPYILRTYQTGPLDHLVRGLIKPVRHHKGVDPDDQHDVLRNLGRLLAARPKIMKDDAETLNPLCYVIAELFCCWTVRGCESVLFVKNSNLSVKDRKIQKMEAERKFGPWFIQLTKKAAERNDQRYDEGLSYIMEPWSRLRPGMEAFLEGWASGVKEEYRSTSSATRSRQTDTGLGCMALRTMATINTRRIPQETAERLAALEAWMGPGENQLSNEIVSTQQAAWDRYLLERSMRGLSKRSVKLLDETMGKSSDKSPTRGRKM